MRLVSSCLLASSLLGACVGAASAQTPAQNGEAYLRAVAASERTLQAWLRDADVKTTLMPDRVDGQARVYTPHNSGADLYPYLILTARLTDPALYRGRMMEMLRNEIRFTTAEGVVPGNLDLATGTLGPASCSAPASTPRTAWSPSPSCSAARPGSPAWPT